MTRVGAPNCIDIIVPLIDELESRKLLDGFQMFAEKWLDTITKNQ